jgi:glyoxylase-like metal-dependent hydrolase (beta-lactamase superfamily II)
MIFRQLIHDDLGCASYLIGDEDAGVAAVVDPKFEIEEYLALARYMGVRIEHVLETHNHADHVSGHGRLAAATGATIHIHRLAAPDYEHEPFDDGWELQLRTVTVRALHTPGHRPEHTAFALIDTARGPEPWAVLSGDTLFVGDIARPDLAVEKREGASGIFHSLHDTLLSLPAECEVWPGHLGGSLCGGPGMDMKISSTIAYEYAHNELLALDNEDEFVRATTSTLRAAAPELPGDRRAQPRSARHRRRRDPAAHATAGRAKAGGGGVDRRRPHRPAVRRRAHPGCGLQPGGARRVRDQARVGRRPRPRRGAPGSRRRRRDPRCAPRSRGRDPQYRRVPRGRHDQLA